MQTALDHSDRPLNLIQPLEWPSAFNFTMREAFQAATRVKEILKNYGKDGENVAALFRFIAKSNSLPHTLFGEKPVSYVSILQDSSSPHDVALATLAQFHSWQMIQSRENLASYNFITRVAQCALSVNPHRDLLVYNRRAIRNAFHSHRELFERKLGARVTLELILNDIDCKDPHNWFGGDLELQGIILGYSPRSAWAFAEKERLCKKYALDYPQQVEEIDHLQCTEQAEEHDEICRLRQLIANMQLTDTIVEDKTLLSGSSRVNFAFLHGDAEALRLSKMYQANQYALRQLDTYEILEYTTLARVAGLL